jgi:HD-GYP domain-containing protein (c-di-GMP phosphodiesterase class II)
MEGVDMAQRNRKKGARKGLPPQASVALIYAAAGAGWIFLSDRLLALFVPQSGITEYQTLKGWLFILVTAAVLYFLAGRHYRAVDEADRAIRDSYDQTLSCLMRALDFHHGETRDHTDRVTRLAVLLSRRMNVDAETAEAVKRGSIIHDIGKLGIPVDILGKPGPLTETERDVVRTHPESARELLHSVPHLSSALDIPCSHHERWDGSGYPRGLQGRQIPLAARIFSVVDVWDALVSDRGYKRAWSREEARRYLAAQSGIEFDPDVVEAFLTLLDEEPEQTFAGESTENNDAL